MSRSRIAIPLIVCFVLVIAVAPLFAQPPAAVYLPAVMGKYATPTIAANPSLFYRRSS